jgi:hypothetical protein
MEGFNMKTYRVVTKQYVYQVAEIKAKSKNEAKRLALESSEIDFDWCDYGAYEIELVEEA